MERATHVVFSTACSSYFDWQSIGLAYSHYHVQQSGHITRLISTCPNDEARNRSSSLPLMWTHEHPDFGSPSVNGVNDAYANYNKPAGLIHWLASQDLRRTADYILLLEPDMLLRRPIDCAAYGVRPGRAAAARYDYLDGVKNGMARSFVKNIHLVQAVGGWACLHRDDLTRLAPLWLEFTKQVRKNPQRYWHLAGDPMSVDQDLDTGDSHTQHGKPLSISDMYGYAFAAAEAGVEHVIVDDIMLYAGHAPPINLPPPSILHYGLWCKIDAPGLTTPWNFNKLSWTGGHGGGFDPHSCDHYFPSPPLPSDLIKSHLDRSSLGAALLCAEVGVRLNAALCEYHHVALPSLADDDGRRPAKKSGSTSFSSLPPCAAVGRRREDALCPAPSLSQFTAAEAASGALGVSESCEDSVINCAAWAELGDCTGHRGKVVRALCPSSCQESRCSKATASRMNHATERVFALNVSSVASPLLPPLSPTLAVLARSAVVVSNRSMHTALISYTLTHIKGLAVGETTPEAWSDVPSIMAFQAASSMPSKEVEKSQPHAKSASGVAKDSEVAMPSHMLATQVRTEDPLHYDVDATLAGCGLLLTATFGFVCAMPRCSLRWHTSGVLHAEKQHAV